jgi:hypothetical protein
MVGISAPRPGGPLFQHCARPKLTSSRICRPELRNELLMAGIINPQGITKAQLIMASHVEIDLDATQVSLTQNPEAFFTAISDLKNWRLREEFFGIFPQYNGVRHNAE